MNKFKDVNVWKYADNFRRYLWLYIEDETGVKTLKFYAKRPNEAYRFIWSEQVEGSDEAARMIHIGEEEGAPDFFALVAETENIEGQL